MPAKSKSQQRLMGMIHAYQKGKLSEAPKKIKDVAKSMKKKDTTEFAKTKHKGLPEHIRKKKKKKSKKSNLIQYLVKLANYLDQQSLTHMADLTDRILNKVATWEDDLAEESSHRIYPTPKPGPKEFPIESDEELEMLPDKELPRVTEYKEHPRFLISAAFRDGTKSLVNVNPETIDFMNRYLKSTQGTGKPFSIPKDPPYSFKEIPQVVSLFLMFYSESPKVELDEKTSEKIVDNMLNLSPEDAAMAGELDHLEINRFDPAGAFTGNPLGELVATYSLDGQLNFLVDPATLNAPPDLELLESAPPAGELSKRPRSQEITEIRQQYPETNFYTDTGELIESPYERRGPEYQEALNKHHQRWDRRFEEAQRRHIKNKYPEDEYTGSDFEIPYGTEIEDFEDTEDNAAF